MDLPFNQPVSNRQQWQAGKPLADRLRPTQWQDFFGQDELAGEQGLLRQMLDRGELTSMILWGPPGSGKTTLALMVSQLLQWRFVAMSAVLTGVKELREAMHEAEQRRNFDGQRTILFIDEIHRFNKGQQDALLPFVEQGSVTLIGATTENPSFELNSALLSRLRVYTLQPHSVESIVKILRRALVQDPQLSGKQIGLSDEVLHQLAEQSSGDARKALNILEYIAAAGVASGEKGKDFDEAGLRKVIQKAVLYHDKSGQHHYDTISALHKSMRNSDPDAALYWLARMLEGGDEPLYIARRLVRFASEDIGLADNRALTVALQAKETADFVGMPECELALAQAVVFMALAPKNNSIYESYKRVKADLSKGEVHPVPYHLRNAVTKFDSQVGFGKGYDYAHDHQEAVTEMSCLPEALIKKLPNQGQGHYYVPKKLGSEAALVEQWYLRRQAVLAKIAKGEKENEPSKK